jgi:hypothetical protein
MNMKEKLYKVSLLIILVIAMVSALFCATFINSRTVFADETSEEIVETTEQVEDVQEEVNDTLPDETEQVSDDEQKEDESGTGTESSVNIEELADSFTAWLKTRYGDDYDYYYNLIITGYGSVESYLLQFGSDYDIPVINEITNWLNEYAVIWVPLLVAIVLVAVYIIGKKQVFSFISKAVDSKINPIVSELNKQSKGIAEVENAVAGLMINEEKFAEQKQALTDSAKELTDVEEES